MRVIAGSAKRKSLICPTGDRTRPTTDRIKETLFNMLQSEIVSDTRFLDLFSGSGGIGIEALSRGAEECVFVEKGREALGCIRTNLENTAFTEKARVFPMDVMQALARLDREGHSFDIVFLDPPYEAGWEDKVLPFLFSSSLVRKGTLVIVETSLKNDRSGEENLPSYWKYLERCKRYKTNCHLFYRAG